MLFNYFNIFNCFKCFKSATSPRHTYVCEFKGGRLWGERWTIMGWKVDDYGVSLRIRREPSKYQSSTQRNSRILALKVDVYGVKGGNSIDQESTIMLE